MHKEDEGTEVQDEDGNDLATPPWKLVLEYEHRVRREAIRAILETQMAKKRKTDAEKTKARRNARGPW